MPLDKNTRRPGSVNQRATRGRNLETVLVSRDQINKVELTGQNLSQSCGVTNGELKLAVWSPLAPLVISGVLSGVQHRRQGNLLLRNFSLIIREPFDTFNLQLQTK